MYDDAACSDTSYANVTQYTTVTVDTCLRQSDYTSNNDVVSFKTICSAQGAMTYSYSSSDSTCSMENSAQITMDDFQCKDFYDYDDGDSVATTRGAMRRERRDRRERRQLLTQSVESQSTVKVSDANVRIDKQMAAIERNRLFPSVSSISRTQRQSSAVKKQQGWIYTYSFADFTSCSTIIPDIRDKRIIWDNRVALLESYAANECIVLNAVDEASLQTSMMFQLLDGKYN